MLYILGQGPLKVKQASSWFHSRLTLASGNDPRSIRHEFALPLIHLDIEVGATTFVKTRKWKCFVHAVSLAVRSWVVHRMQLVAAGNVVGVRH